MKKLAACFALIASCTLAFAAELKVSTTEPLVVQAASGWTSAPGRAPNAAFPFETYRLSPSPGKNAACLISVIDKDRTEFATDALLMRILRGDCRPYASSASELAAIPLKPLIVANGGGFYADFIDPDLVGKPVQTGNYKVATPIILHIGSAYLIKASILSDAVDGPDYAEAMAMVRSLQIKKQNGGRFAMSVRHRAASDPLKSR